MKLGDQIKWCFKKKQGIRIIEPNIDVSKSNIISAKVALDAMQLMRKSGNLQWAVITAYYARYDILYALLMKCGIKCEIHDCTIALMKYLFVGEGLLDEEFYAELLSAKELRIKSQYYPNKQIDSTNSKAIISSTPQFVLAVEELIESLSSEQNRVVREKLRAL